MHKIDFHKHPCIGWPAMVSQITREKSGMTQIASDWSFRVPAGIWLQNVKSLGGSLG
jgi:hypothetical protein